MIAYCKSAQPRIKMVYGNRQPFQRCGYTPTDSSGIHECRDAGVSAALANALEQTLKKVEAGARLVLLNWLIGEHSLAPAAFPSPSRIKM
jgi:hypothetical protein